MRWAAWPKRNRDGSRDRLCRWLVVDEDTGGRGKMIIAENIRTEEHARAIASALDARTVIRDLLMVVFAVRDSLETDEAIARAEAWLAENGSSGI
jgi:hypothetical protein